MWMWKRECANGLVSNCIANKHRWTNESIDVEQHVRGRRQKHTRISLSHKLAYNIYIYICSAIHYG